MMRKLNHPNIVKLYEVHETVNSIYFVIDLIEGGELLNRVRETGIYVKISSRIFTNTYNVKTSIQFNKCIETHA